MSDGGRLEQPRGELVEQRLEGVVVVLVDDDDVGVFLAQLLSDPDAGEAAAEDQHARVGADAVIVTRSPRYP